ncbi:aldehyde dehydrogenase family protein [Oceanicaulis sp. AH-315-P02]|nr:aldehyde dehydrogenase family protein [Robiginitomaculum sp.]MBN4047766.1 aldehyde dehydrogenase family protein [Oceanicaulis sp. AH-315-P02]
MQILNKFYIDGKWVTPNGTETLDVINPANEEAYAKVVLGTAKDVDLAVASAQKAFPTWSKTSRAERLEVMGRFLAAYHARLDDIAKAITEEMGAPAWIASAMQAPVGLGLLTSDIETLKTFEFTEQRGNSMVVREPVGVCGLITPWNWPMNQIFCKLSPALATGCTVVWKPSEVSPVSAQILMEIIDEAKIPAGVVNMVHGDGPVVGNAIASHPGIDMVSFTGSTSAGISVAKAAAPTVKRVAQELGGKSANIILDDLDVQGFAKAVSGGMQTMSINSGQNCNAPSRMLVPAARMQEALKIAAATANAIQVAEPNTEGMVMGPVVSEAQWNRIQNLIAKGIEQGAELVAGGLGRPEDLNRGFYVRPTVFGNVTNDMAIAREEIFGPVLCILGYDDEDQAIEIANDTLYGLSGYISGNNIERVREVAAKLRTGMVHLNGATPDFTMPFGGYGQSGNGRERGPDGFDEYLESKSILGYSAE